MNNLQGIRQIIQLVLLLELEYSLLGAYRTPNTLPVVLIEVIGTRVYVGTIQVQVVAIKVTVRSRRPIVAPLPPKKRRRGIEAAGVEKVVRISS